MKGCLQHVKFVTKTNNQIRAVFSRNFLDCLQPEISSFLLFRVHISGLQIIYKVFLQQARITFLGDVCIRFCLLYFAPCNGIFHVLIFRVPNIFAEFDCMFVTFVLEWGHLVCSSTFEHSYSWLGHHSGTLLWYLLWIIWAAYTRVYLVMAESLDVWEYKFTVYLVRGQFNK